MDKEKITELIEKYTSDNLNDTEVSTLLQLLDNKAHREIIEGILQDSYLSGLFRQEETQARKSRLEALMQKRMQESSLSDEVPYQRPIRSIFGWSWVAACIILVITATVIFRIFSEKQVVFSNNLIAATQDIIPGKEGAILTLSDGRQVVLDSMRAGLIASQNGADVILKNNRLAYDVTGSANGEVVYNTIHTPKGRQFHVSLPDGTQVWLNSASSIRYPTIFTGNERLVTITGEAYLEIAKNTRMPFRVKVNANTEIEVLGTRFNINAYSNEMAVSTTLTEGSVKVTAARQAVILKAGEQAQTQSNGPIKVLSEVDLNQVTAWKNGYFDFNNADLSTMMRQIERWYDVEVVYEGKVPEVVFKGKMDRNVLLSDVVKFLKLFHINTRLEGRTFIISEN